MSAVSAAASSRSVARPRPPREPAARVPQLADQLGVVDRTRRIVGERAYEDRVLLAERMRPRGVDAERTDDPRRTEERRDDHRADAERRDRAVGSRFVRERRVAQVVVGRDDPAGLDGLSRTSRRRRGAGGGGTRCAARSPRSRARARSAAHRGPRCADRRGRRRQRAAGPPPRAPSGEDGVHRAPRRTRDGRGGPGAATRRRPGSHRGDTLAEG